MPDFTISDTADAKVVLEAIRPIFLKAVTGAKGKYGDGKVVQSTGISCDFTFDDDATAELLAALGVTP